MIIMTILTITTMTTVAITTTIISSIMLFPAPSPSYIIIYLLVLSIQKNAHKTEKNTYKLIPSEQIPRNIASKWNRQNFETFGAPTDATAPAAAGFLCGKIPDLLRSSRAY